MVILNLTTTISNTWGCIHSERLWFLPYVGGAVDPVKLLMITMILSYEQGSE